MKRYSEVVRRLRKQVEYWTQVATREFLKQLTAQMTGRDISRAKIAEEIGVTRPYISKIMRGDVNFTLETMTKLALAVDGRVSVKIVRKDANRWQPVVVNLGEQVGVGVGLNARHDHWLVNQWIVHQPKPAESAASSRLKITPRADAANQRTYYQLEERAACQT